MSSSGFGAKSGTQMSKVNEVDDIDDDFSSSEEEYVELCLPEGPLDGADLHDPFISKIGGLPASLFSLRRISPKFSSNRSGSIKISCRKIFDVAPALRSSFCSCRSTRRLPKDPISTVSSISLGATRGFAPRGP